MCPRTHKWFIMSAVEPDRKPCHWDNVRVIGLFSKRQQTLAFGCDKDRSGSEAGSCLREFDSMDWLARSWFAVSGTVEEESVNSAFCYVCCKARSLLLVWYWTVDGRTQGIYQNIYYINLGIPLWEQGNGNNWSLWINKHCWNPAHQLPMSNRLSIVYMPWGRGQQTKIITHLYYLCC